MKRALKVIGLLVLASLLLLLSVSSVSAASLTHSVVDMGNCTWNVTLSGTGFTPGSTIYVDMSGSEWDCNNNPVITGWGDWVVGDADGNGNFSFTVVHRGWGNYDYTMRDFDGNESTTYVSYSQSGAVSTATPSPTPTAQTQGTACVGAFSIGDYVRITPGLSNRLRSGAGLSYSTLSMLAAGTRMALTAGPTCADGFVWWHVQTDDERSGWTVQGDAEGLWLELDDDEYRGDPEGICSVPVRAYIDTERGGRVLEVPLNPLPQSFELFFGDEHVPDSRSGVRHRFIPGESLPGLSYLRVSDSWIAGHSNWETDSLWYIAYTGPC